MYWPNENQQWAKRARQKVTNIGRKNSYCSATEAHWSVEQIMQECGVHTQTQLLYSCMCVCVLVLVLVLWCRVEAQPPAAPRRCAAIIPVVTSRIWIALVLLGGESATFYPSLGNPLFLVYCTTVPTLTRHWYTQTEDISTEDIYVIQQHFYRDIVKFQPLQKTCRLRKFLLAW